MKIDFHEYDLMKIDFHEIQALGTRCLGYRPRVRGFGPWALGRVRVRTLGVRFHILGAEMQPRVHDLGGQGYEVLATVCIG